MKGTPWASGARRTAHQLIRDEARWSHTCAAAAAAVEVAWSLEEDDAEVLLAAAWLHDIGYSTELADTGFHPLDGARFLRARGAPARLCRLVANHTGARFEAEARGLGVMLASEFPAEVSPLADALTFVDLVSGPRGERLTPEERIEEILERYAAGHCVHESILRGRPDLIAAARRVQERLSPSSLLGRDLRQIWDARE